MNGWLDGCSRVTGFASVVIGPHKRANNVVRVMPQSCHDEARFVCDEDEPTNRLTSLVYSLVFLSVKIVLEKQFIPANPFECGMCQCWVNAF